MNNLRTEVIKYAKKLNTSNLIPPHYNRHITNKIMNSLIPTIPT